MLRITILADTDDVFGVKETLREYLERFGDVKIVDVQRVTPGQSTLFER